MRNRHDMKSRSVYICEECGASSPRWAGKCPDCGAWNSMEEQPAPSKSATNAARRAASGSVIAPTATPIPLNDVTTTEQPRISTGIGELDRVLGGGMVRGSVVLLGGEPGIGKSTLLLQALGRMASSLGNVLYVSGEESLRQMKLRADRLSIDTDALLLLCETSVEAILHHAERQNPAVLVIDSIQTTTVNTLESAPGGVAQIRESAATLIRHAKATDTPIFLVGHVTKEGSLAGPKVLEHMVDTVVYFEGDDQHAYRLVRATKNRYGSTNELSVFEMTGEGLRPVENPSELFLSQRSTGTPGSVVVCAVEGTRPLLLELQALVIASQFNTPTRVAEGIDRNRLSLLIAVLEKRGGMGFGNADVFVNVTGGVELSEPSADLGVIAAMASSHRDTPIDPKTVIIGEVGLGGEVRPVSRLDRRLIEAAKLGFERAIIPSRQMDAARSVRKEIAGLKPVGVSNIHEALVALFA